MTQAERRHDRLAVRLSLIISRLVAGETLNMARLAAEFGVSVRTLRRDFANGDVPRPWSIDGGNVACVAPVGGVQGELDALTFAHRAGLADNFSGAGPASGGHAAHCRRDAVSGMAAATVCVTGHLTGVLPSRQCNNRLPAGAAAGRGRAL